MRLGSALGIFRVIGGIATMAVVLAQASPGYCDSPPAQPANLAVNPMFARLLPPPGWLAGHVAAWPDEHPAYRAPCQNSEVIDEIHYLNRVIGNAQAGLDLVDAKGDPAKALRAEHLIDDLHRDIIAADALTARLQALPACGVAPPKPAVAVEAPAPARPAPTPPPALPPVRPLAAVEAPAPARPTPPPLPPDVPPAKPLAAVEAPAPVRPAPTPPPPPDVPPTSVNPASPVISSTVPLPVTAAPIMSSTVPLQVTAAPVPAPAAAPATPKPAEPAPAPVAIIRPTPSSPQRLVIQFDERSPALTQAGTRTFKDAVDVVHAGKPVTIAIEGCDAKADFSNGSLCARRRANLMALLAQNGINDPQRLLADGR
jgi:hypothetical protein